MENYVVMHMDRRVATVRSDGSCTVYFPSFMPYNLYLEPVGQNDPEGRVNNIQNFYYWCSSRMLTLDRKYVKEILNSLGKKQAVTDKDRAEISISYHALSLTDVYWVRRKGEKLSFSQINLYDHPLSDSFVDVCLRGKGLTAENAGLIDDRDVAGDIGTAGVAPKAWIRKDGTFFLLKDGDLRDVRAELLAGRIADCFDVEHVGYLEDSYAGAAVTSCRMITGKDRSIVPMEFMNIYAANNDIDLMSYILKKDAYSFYMMNILDYLTGNTDRHWGNWGFWVDNRNNKPGKLYPLMDFNKAFLSYDTEDGGICQTVPGRISQKEAALEAVEKIGLNMNSEPKREWFPDDGTADMFFRRLSVLKQKAAESYSCL